MKKADNRTTKLARFAAAAGVVTLALIATAPTAALAEDSDKGSPFPGLVPVEDAKVGMAYIDPKADFTVFKRVAILDPYVAFRANWEQDQNRSRTRPIRTSDMERIKSDVAKLLKEVFAERLEADDGYEITKVADYDVLGLKPAIVELDITAPDTTTIGASRSFSASTGSATLYIELFDTVSGAIIGRAADTQGADQRGTFQMTGSGVNTEEARRIFEGWADQLRSFLDEHYTKKK